MPIQFRDGRILFVGGRIAMSPDCCCGERCVGCDSGHLPEEVYFTQSGIINSTCTDCSRKNDTFVLGLPAPGSFAEYMAGSPTAWNNNPVYCVRGYVFPTNVCIGEFDEESEIILFYSQVDNKFYVINYSPVAGGQIAPQFSTTSRDCENWNGLSLTRETSGSYSCNSNNATGTLSA